MFGMQGGFWHGSEFAYVGSVSSPPQIWIVASLGAFATGVETTL
jgi:hypothetical protein